MTRLPGSLRLVFLTSLAGLALLLLAGPFQSFALLPRSIARADSNINGAFDQASQRFGVPVALLKALCQMEGHLSMHGGSASIDGGYGCMHLVKNTTSPSAFSRGSGQDQGIGIDLIKARQVDTLSAAASDLNVSIDQLKTDMASNILGGAAVLRDYALKLSGNQTLPASLADWYGAVAAYSNATTQSNARSYADSVFNLVKSGFSAATESGEVIMLAPTQVQPNLATASNVQAATPLPKGCVNDGKTEFPGAIDCIVDPTVFDCNLVSDTAPCTYLSANRPNDLPLNFIAIHDIEGSAQDGINAFEDPTTGVSIHYIVDVDGTVYQLLHEKDIAFHIGNFWYNQRSLGIEHAGFDATGFLWYNATQYLSSARLVAYLANKYHIPIDHDHIVSHGTVPSPTLASSPNHVDPGPYWLWDYYLKQISKQERIADKSKPNAHVISIHADTGIRPLGKDGKETAANFNFFYLYNGPSTQSGLIAPKKAAADITNETIDVEANLSYFFLSAVKDPAGTGDTMYEIWYGTQPQSSDTPADFSAHAKQVWLAAPAGAAQIGSSGTVVSLSASGSDTFKIYGRPITSDTNVIGDAPTGATFVSLFTATEDGTTNLWYEINYNHRQAWVPAAEVTIVPPDKA